MKSRKSSPIRWLIAAAVIIAAAAFYSYREKDAAAGVKAEVREIIMEMDLMPAWEDAALKLVDVAHPQAFQSALDVTRELGRKFDETVYYDELFDRVIAFAREDGKHDLADSLDRQRRHFQLTVTEK